MISKGQFACRTLESGEIVSMTVPANVASWGVMQKIGMHRDPADDFEHPRVPEGHRLRNHVLYRLSQSAYSTKSATV